jgi:fused signal recognition particle receptor
MVFNFVNSSFNKIKNALQKTRSILGAKISSLFSGKIDEDTLEQLEQLLYEADVGVKTATELTKTIRASYSKNPNMKPDEVITLLKQEMTKGLETESHEIKLPLNLPFVILIVGVNGNGKTTTVAKLAKKFKDEGKKVLVAAADTFRAGAIHQLEIWAERIDIEIVKGAPKSDPSSVVFDALSAAISRKSDVVIIDTAGRLHTKIDLMQELEKIKRTCKKLLPNSPHETFLVLDATTGQNAVDQARIFNQYTPITGIVLTKLDGTAKGGIVLNLHTELKLPVKFIGVGENMDDLERFDAATFINALFD